MNKFYQRLEATANVLIVVTAVLLIVFFIQKLFFSADSKPAMLSPKVGNQVTLADVDFSQSKKTVFLVLQKGCHFCSTSADFYKKLITETKDKDIKIIAFLPQEINESKAYLNELGIQGIEVRQSQMNSLDVSGTPTIIVLDNKGEVSNFWIGKLPPEKEKEVFEKLNS